MIVGALPPPVIGRLLDDGIEVSSAAITVTRSRVAHMRQHVVALEVNYSDRIKLGGALLIGLPLFL